VSAVVKEDKDGGSSLLAAADFLSRSAATACSSSRSCRAACTRQRATTALASVLSASLMRVSSRNRRASASWSVGMAVEGGQRPREGGGPVEGGGQGVRRPLGLGLSGSMKKQALITMLEDRLCRRKSMISYMNKVLHI
jgi:hypothetical protein